jgi:phosphoglycerol transferase MdoB-like AlkP superfamily enzyme
MISGGMKVMAWAGPPSWTRSRFGFVGFWMLSLMAGWLILRIILFISFRPAPAPPVMDSVLAFFSGTWRDLVAAIWLSLPLLFWLLIVPDRCFGARWHRRIFWAACLMFWVGQIFLIFVEYFFFEEFRSRFNTVAVDYLQYPKEVFVNIWDSYHVGIVLAFSVAVATGWVLVASRLFAAVWEYPSKDKSRLLIGVAAMVLAIALTPLVVTAGTLAGVMRLPVRLKGPRVSVDRTLNEIANNGDLSFFAAAWTHNLDYAAFYRTGDKDIAYQRTRQLLAESGSQWLEPGRSIRRQVQGDASRPRLNVVILLEESLGSEFWGCLGRTNTLTPQMDRLALEEGLLFTNIYASGNRTVRGMEGVLSSFPPLPGESIVKRDRSDNVETLARVLKRDGYSTLFLYGGRGVFDGMRSFALRNGYDRFIEQKHFEHPTFTTIWGVCDEDLYERSVREIRQFAKAGQPFFATVLSVSNHKPFTYPRGRIPENPDEQRRENAVKYCDYALGRFFRAAKQEAFWTNTIFVVVADHGARVYGEQSIPIHSYEIPILIAGPAVVKAPCRLGQLGCSLDIAPTVLGLIGRPYQSVFFGCDLFQTKQGRALLNHNREIGMLSRDRLVVLGLMQTVEVYAGDPKRVEMTLLATTTESDCQLEQDTVAVFQVADDLYMQQRFRVESALPTTASARRQTGSPPPAP